MKKVFSLAILAAFALAATAHADREYSFEKKQNFDGNTVQSIRIDMHSGDIRIERSESSEITLEFKNDIYAESEKKAEDLNDDCEIGAEQSGDALEVRVDLPRRHRSRNFLDRLFSGNWNDNIHVFLRLRIPEGKAVQIDASSTDIEVSGIRLDLDVRGSSSDIEMTDTGGNVAYDLSSGDVYVSRHNGDLKISGNSSDIRIDDVKGNVDIRTSSGDGRVDKVDGSLTVSTSSGDYRIYDISGDLDIGSSSGDLYVDGVAGSARAESSSGDIRLNALSAEQGDFEIDTVSGDVTIEVNRDFAGRLSLRTVSGDINSQMTGEIETLTDSRLVATVGDGNGLLKVSTSSGDIRVARY